MLKSSKREKHGSINTSCSTYTFSQWNKNVYKMEGVNRVVYQADTCRPFLSRVLNEVAYGKGLEMLPQIL